MRELKHFWSNCWCVPESRTLKCCRPFVFLLFAVCWLLKSFFAKGKVMPRLAQVTTEKHNMCKNTQMQRLEWVGKSFFCPVRIPALQRQQLGCFVCLPVLRKLILLGRFRWESFLGSTWNRIHPTRSACSLAPAVEDPVLVTWPQRCFLWVFLKPNFLRRIIGLFGWKLPKDFSVPRGQNMNKIDDVHWKAAPIRAPSVVPVFPMFRA